MNVQMPKIGKQYFKLMEYSYILQCFEIITNEITDKTIINPLIPRVRTLRMKCRRDNKHFAADILEIAEKDLKELLKQGQKMTIH